MAGHSKWANIKHRKARQDAVKGRQWSKCARAIIVAAKVGGGDPDTNLTLRYAMDDAKAANMPKNTIENAIKKGVGGGSDEDYESVVYEGYGPGGVALLVETLTNNRNRTAGELRTVFDRNGGNLGTSGSVAYLFESKGIITLPRDAVEEEKLMEIVLEAGAEDVADDGDIWSVTTGPTEYRSVKDALAEAGLGDLTGSLTMVPETTVEVSGEDARKVLALIESLEENDDVQKVHANLDLPDNELAQLEK